MAVGYVSVVVLQMLSKWTKKARRLLSAILKIAWCAAGAWQNVPKKRLYSLRLKRRHLSQAGGSALIERRGKRMQETKERLDGYRK
jgi:hypothetical protein